MDIIQSAEAGILLLTQSSYKTLTLHFPDIWKCKWYTKAGSKNPLTKKMVNKTEAEVSSCL